MMLEPVIIAIVNSTPDAVQMLRDVFDRAGFLPVSCYTHDIRDGKLDFDAFIRQHQPRVIVYDIAPPYERNVRLFAHIRAMPVCAGMHFVITSMNPARAAALLGRDEQIYEVVDREEDVLRLVKAVKEAARARAVR